MTEIALTVRHITATAMVDGITATAISMGVSVVAMVVHPANVIEIKSRQMLWITKFQELYIPISLYHRIILKIWLYTLAIYQE